VRIPRARFSVHATYSMSRIDTAADVIVALGAEPAEPAAAAHAYFLSDIAGALDHWNCFLHLVPRMRGRLALAH